MRLSPTRATTDKMMYESDDIIRYLFTTYGDGEIPGALTAGFLTTLSAGLGNLGRCVQGRCLWGGPMQVGSAATKALEQVHAGQAVLCPLTSPSASPPCLLAWAALNVLAQQASAACVVACVVGALAASGHRWR